MRCFAKACFNCTLFLHGPLILQKYWYNNGRHLQWHLKFVRFNENQANKYANAKFNIDGNEQGKMMLMNIHFRWRFLLICQVNTLMKMSEVKLCKWQKCHYSVNLGKWWFLVFWHFIFLLHTTVTWCFEFSGLEVGGLVLSYYNRIRCYTQKYETGNRSCESVDRN